jgi:hypothetical protein
MSDWLGASPEDLLRLATACSSAADQLKSVVRVVDTAVAGVVWEGVDSSRFETEWESQHRTAVTATETSLRALADILLRNREEQVKASGGATLDPAAAAEAAMKRNQEVVNGFFHNLFGGGPDFPGNPSGAPFVVSSELVTVDGKLDVGVGFGGSYGFKLEHLSDGTVRVTELADGFGEVRGGAAGAEITASWGSHTAHAGAIADASVAITGAAGVSYVVKDDEAAKNLILHRLMGDVPLGNTSARVGTDVAGLLLPKGLEDATGVSALHDAATFHMPKKDSGFVSIGAKAEAGASGGLAQGGSLSGSLEGSVGYERDRHGNNTFLFEASGEASGKLDFLLPGGAFEAKGQVMVRPSVTLDRHGRPTTITDVVEWGVGDKLHRRTVTFDLTDPRLARSADALVRGLTHPSQLDDSTRGLINSAVGATTSIDETLELHDSAYGAGIAGELELEAGGSFHVNVQSLELTDRQVIGTGRRP